MDSAILMNPEVWVASGHVGNFNDTLMDCKECKARFRADKLIEDYAAQQGTLDIHPDGWGNDVMEKYIKDNGIPCPECGKKNFTAIRKFNMMFKTFQGVNEDTASELYLRPETAQGIFVNFKNVQRTSRKKIPFGIAQIGKSFRNEITPGNFTFRTREFEQMEMEFFCEPGTELEWFRYWKQFCKDFLISLGMKEEHIKLRDHEKEELSHYSNATTDIEFLYPFGWGELWGIASRTDFDLRQHAQHSGENLEYQDPFTNQKYVPYCIEPALGADRAALSFLCDAYDEEELENGETRTVMHLHPALSPFKAAILPLQKKLGEKAGDVYSMLSKKFMVDYDESGAIGRRYRRQDEIGTPMCITIDFDTLEDDTVTVRDRDTMEQIRLPIDKLVEHIDSKVNF
jgi:glycyl-tRNA synthetase